MKQTDESNEKTDCKTNLKTVKRKRKPFNHVACYSYPNCDEDPNGCLAQTPREYIDAHGFKD